MDKKIPEERVRQIAETIAKRQQQEYLKSDPVRRYELLDRVPGSKSVYRGRDKLTDQFVAVKRFRPFELDRADAGGVEANEQEENAILFELDYTDILQPHPNLIGWHGQFDNNERASFMVLDYCPAGNLRQFLAGNTWSDKSDTKIVRQWMCEILNVLNHCHTKHGVIHCAIAPQHLLLSSDKPPVLKLCDFGRAIKTTEQFILREDDQFSEWSNTDIAQLVFYWPPEVLANPVFTHNITPAFDVWSAGCIFVELLQKMYTQSPNGPVFQVKPTTENKKDLCHLFQDVLDVIQSQLPSILKRVAQWDKDIAPLLVRMLDLDPAKRCSIAEVLSWFQKVDLK